MQSFVGGPTPVALARPYRCAALLTTCGSCWTVEGPSSGSWSRAYRPKPCFSLPADHLASSSRRLAWAAGASD
eukprot:801382-Alexandrium_andersonii.AAC.1